MGMKAIRRWQPTIFFRVRLDQIIDLGHLLAVLANQMPSAQSEAVLAPAFGRKNRQGQAVAGSDLFGVSPQIAGTGISTAGRLRLPIRLIEVLLYLKHYAKLNACHLEWETRRGCQSVVLVGRSEEGGGHGLPRGEPADAVSRDVAVPIYKLPQWCDRTLAASDAGSRNVGVDWIRTCVINVD